MSLELLSQSSISDIALELDISTAEAECLKQTDDEWRNSLSAVLYEIHLKFKNNLAKKSCNAITELAKRPEDLKKLDESAQLKIPLAVRSWLKNKGLLNDMSEDRKQSVALGNPHAEQSCSERRKSPSISSAPVLGTLSPSHSNVQATNPSVGEDLDQLDKSDSSGHRCQNNTARASEEGLEWSTGGAEEVLETELRHRRASDALGDDAMETETVLNEDKLDWVQGQRLEVVCCLSGESKSGTVMYVLETECIVLMDDFRIQKINPSRTKIIQGAAPSQIQTSLIAAILKAPDSMRSSASMIRKYLRQDQGIGRSKLDAVAYASGVLTENYPGLEFRDVIGEGGYGTVVSVRLRNGDSAAIKMEISSGYPNVTDSSLWRESNILAKPPNRLTGHVPKLIKGFGAHAFIRIYDENHTIGLLCMEVLLPFAKTVFKQASLIDGNSIPDSYRHLAQDQLYLLKCLHESGLNHGDVKNGHWMMSSEHGQVVLVDFGQSERKDWSYTQGSTQQSRYTPSAGRILLASDSLPSTTGASSLVPMLKRLGQDRPGTKGFRPQNTARNHDERQKADLWALGVGWLEGVGVAPCADTSVQFEERLYSSLSSVGKFTQMIREYENVSSTIVCNDGSLHPSVSMWLALVYSILIGGMSVLELLQSSPTLTQPFYKPSFLERLRTIGIIVPGVKATGGRQKGGTKEIKPVLLMHVEDVGLIVLCLLWYLEDECLALYGGKVVEQESAESLYSPCHNLSIGCRQIIFGAVSKYFGIEDFIEHSAIGSFIKSSNVDPAVTVAGSLKLPQRYYPRTNGNMSVVPMITRLKHGPGMQPTWPYPWNSGTGTALFPIQKINEMQAIATRRLPDSVWTAVAEARLLVLGQGEFRDAAVPTSSKAALLSQDMPDAVRRAFLHDSNDSTLPTCFPQHDQCDPDAASVAESLAQEIVLPLPQEWVTRIESAFSREGGIDPKSRDNHDWSDTKKNAEIIETKEQFESKGLPIFDDIPKTRTQAFEKALLADDGGQGIVFLNASNLALTSSKRLKEVIGNGELLYARVCQPETRAENSLDDAGGSLKIPEFGPDESAAESSPGVAEESSDCPDSGPAGKSRGARRQAGDNSSAGLGGGPGSGGDSSCEPSLAAWLLIVMSYLSNIPEKYWKVIFQHVHGSAADRSGDERRSECKGDKWPRPEKAINESEDNFLNRLAGYYALQYFFSELFHAIINILPRGANFTTQFWPCMSSFLASDRTDGDVEAQDPHNDKVPRLGERCYSLLVNISNLFSHLGILVNSCPNIKRMLKLDHDEFGLFQQRFVKTYSISQPDKLLSDVMGEGGLEGKVRFAWLQYLAVQRLAEFDEMFPVYAKMPPVMVALFDTDCTHWGPPYPMPGIVYPQYYQLIHFR